MTAFIRAPIPAPPAADTWTDPVVIIAQTGFWRGALVGFAFGILICPAVYAAGALFAEPETRAASIVVLSEFERTAP
jgi:sulfite exporter TauE/SafE